MLCRENVQKKLIKHNSFWFINISKDKKVETLSKEFLYTFKVHKHSELKYFFPSNWSWCLLVYSLQSCQLNKFIWLHLSHYNMTFYYSKLKWYSTIAHESLHVLWYRSMVYEWTIYLKFIFKNLYVFMQKQSSVWYFNENKSDILVFIMIGGMTVIFQTALS